MSSFGFGREDGPPENRPFHSYPVHSPYNSSVNLGDHEHARAPSYLETLPRLDLPSDQAAGFDLGNPNFLPLPAPSSFLPQPHFRHREVDDLVTSLSLNAHPEDQFLPPLQLTRPGGFRRSNNSTENLPSSASLPRLPPLSTMGRVTIPPLPPMNSNPSDVCRNQSTADQRNQGTSATSLRLPSLASSSTPQYSTSGLSRAPHAPDLHDVGFSMNASIPSRRAGRPNFSFDNLSALYEDSAGSTGSPSLPPLEATFRCRGCQERGSADTMDLSSPRPEHWRCHNCRDQGSRNDSLSSPNLPSLRSSRRHEFSSAPLRPFPSDHSYDPMSHYSGSTSTYPSMHQSMHGGRTGTPTLSGDIGQYDSERYSRFDGEASYRPDGVSTWGPLPPLQPLSSTDGPTTPTRRRSYSIMDREEDSQNFPLLPSLSRATSSNTADRGGSARRGSTSSNKRGRTGKGFPASSSASTSDELEPEFANLTVADIPLPPGCSAFARWGSNSFDNQKKLFIERKRAERAAAEAVSRGFGR